MNCKELVEGCKRKLEDQLVRADAAIGSCDDDAWNRAVPKGWSPAQIFEHLVLSNATYLDIFDHRLPSAPEGNGPVLQSFLGKMVLKAAGPAGNAPAPKAFVPGPGPYSKEVFDRWRAQQLRLIEFCSEANGKEIGVVRVPNPLLKWVKMTLCDCFLIVTDHTERHVRQIEERVGIS